MTNREKVIKRLEEVIAEAVYPDRPRKFMMPLDLAEEALELLKAQEPVEPIMRRVVFECDAFSDAENKMYCPKCKVELMTRVNYCPNCGKAVKWE